MAIPCEQANYMDFHYQKGPVVGRIVGTTCEKHQEAVKEDRGKIYSQS